MESLTNEGEDSYEKILGKGGVQEKYKSSSILIGSKESRAVCKKGQSTTGLNPGTHFLGTY